MSIDDIFSNCRNRQTASLFVDPGYPHPAGVDSRANGIAWCDALVGRDRSMIDRRYRGRWLSDMLA